MNKPATLLLDLEQLSGRLGLSTATLRKMVRRGEIPAIRIGKNVLRFAESDIETFINSRRVK